MKPIFSSQLPRLPRRPLDSHKTSVGSVCVVGGSYGMAGAAALAAGGALAAGAGYVRVVCPDDVYPILAVLVPSAVFIPVRPQSGSYARAEIDRALAAVDASSAAVIGPGLGEATGAEALFLDVCGGCPKPLVIDASALNILAAKPRTPQRPGAPRIITPHPGEAARLLGATAAAVQSDRADAVARLASLFGCVAVLKGARTLVCDGQTLYENTSGNAGMAKAGSGDVLAGVIAALIAQGVAPVAAARLGVYLHGKAGDIAAASKGRGLTAEDIVSFLPQAVLEFDGGLFEKATST